MTRNLEVVLCYLTSLPGVESKDFSRENGLLLFGVVWQRSQAGGSSGVALVPSQGECGCRAAVWWDWGKRFACLSLSL